MGVPPPKPGSFSQWILTKKAKPLAPKPEAPKPEAPKAPAPTREDQLRAMAEEIEAARKVVQDLQSKDPGKK